jgi:hypothetical protein
VTYSPGAAGWLNASLNSTITPATITVQPTTISLSPGTYTAMIAVTSPSASNSPQTAAVTLTVAASVGGIRVATVTGGSALDPNGYVLSLVVTGGVARSVSVGINATATLLDVPTGTHRVELSDVASNCIVTPPNPRTITVVESQTMDSTFNVLCQAQPAARRLSLRNSIPASLNLHEIVQVKVGASRNDVLVRNDLLTDDDPVGCLVAPGESIASGRSRSFDITIGDNYWVFIGIGIWDLDGQLCPTSAPWFKRRFFTEPNFNLHYVWTTVSVTGHSGGDYGWTVSGSYLNGTLVVTPSGGAAIPFNVTPNNPIP